MLEPLTLSELTALKKDGYSSATISELLRKRGVSEDVSASSVLTLLLGKKTKKDYPTLLDVMAEAHPDLTLNELMLRQEQKMLPVWLPVALATLCAMVSATKGGTISVGSLLASWGLSRLSRWASRIDTSGDRDEAFLRMMGD